VAERSPVELMLVDRAGAWTREGDCGSCGRHTALPFGLFVGSYGDPCGIIELCVDCAPLADRLAERIAELTHGQAAILVNEEATPN
jgi:hypothetical protein